MLKRGFTINIVIINSKVYAAEFYVKDNSLDHNCQLKFCKLKFISFFQIVMPSGHTIVVSATG